MYISIVPHSIYQLNGLRCAQQRKQKKHNYHFDFRLGARGCSFGNKSLSVMYFADFGFPFFSRYKKARTLPKDHCARVVPGR